MASYNSGLLSLAQKLDNLANNLDKEASDIAFKVAVAIVADLATVTPADTGAAISNWQIIIGDVSTLSILPPFVPSPRGKFLRGTWTHTVDPQITRAANKPLTIQSAVTALNAKVPGEAIMIVNMLPYIESLDRGSSKQQPAGFVDRAVLIGKSIVVAFSNSIVRKYNL